MNWSKATLGELANEYGGVVQTGPFGSQLHQSDYRDYGTPTIMPQDIVNDRIVTDSIARVDDVMVRKLSRHVLQVGDIIYPRRGDLNKRAIISEREAGWLCGTGCIKISLPNSTLVPQYLFYYLKQPHVVKWIENKAVGSTMLNLSASILKTVEIEYPDKETQQHIANIISAYDTFIDNNNRRISLLEESIHLLYKEWFVKLRFPEYEKIKIVDGIPEGWERLPFGEALILQRGFDLPNRNRKIGNVPVYASTGIHGFHNTAKVKGPGIVTGRSGTLGSVMYVQNDFWPLNTTLWVKEFKKVTIYFAYFLLLNMDLESYRGGAAVPTLNRNAIHAVEISIPDKQLQNNFDLIAKPILDKIELLNLYNEKLREARDQLLPRLMNGSIAV